jgi:hypothetical protein
MDMDRSTAIAVTLFCGEPSINRSGIGEIDQSVALLVDHAHDADLLNTSEIRSVKISSCIGRDPLNVIGPTCWQSIDASDLSSAMPKPPFMPPVLARET